MSNTAKYIAIAVAVWLVWSYLNTNSTTVAAADDCGSKGGCGESDPTDISQHTGTSQIPSGKIPGSHLKYAQTQVVR